MINAEQLRTHIIRPTLQKMSQVIPYSEQAVELLMMTAAHESKLGSYLHQINGPALGIYQMEPETLEDIDNNFLRYRSKLRNVVDFAAYLNPNTAAEKQNLIGNLFYATAMARVHYYRVSEAIPHTIRDLSKYAKEHFNTIAGKATGYDYYQAYLDRCF